jgi:CheY-like chemotaxis protein
VASILYVDDDPFWTEILRKALHDHTVDVAASLQEAVDRLQWARNQPYDLALVDLNLVGGNDGLGGEVLDAIRLRYPSTRRVVITGSPPSGSVKYNIFDRYGVQEVILKAQAGYLPDLRRVVEHTLATQATDLPPHVLEMQSELRERLYVMRRDALLQADEWIHAEGQHANNAARLHPESARRADEGLRRALRWRESVVARYDELGQAVGKITSIGQVTELTARLSEIESELENMRNA